MQPDQGLDAGLGAHLVGSITVPPVPRPRPNVRLPGRALGRGGGGGAWYLRGGAHIFARDVCLERQ